MTATETLCCGRCLRGQEACQYCHDAPTVEDWMTICDCGLESHGHHLFDCVSRENYRWVVAVDYASAEEKR